MSDSASGTSGASLIYFGQLKVVEVTWARTRRKVVSHSHILKALWSVLYASVRVIKLQGNLCFFFFVLLVCTSYITRS